MTGDLSLGNKDYDSMADQRKIPIDELCLVPTFEFFGPPTPAFLQHIKDEKWQEKLKRIAEKAERPSEAAKKAGDKVKSFKDWGIEDCSDLAPKRHKRLSVMFENILSDRASRS